MTKAPIQSRGRRTLLGKLLRDYRLKNELTQTELQLRLGCGGQGYISKVETGLIATPDSDFLAAMAKEVKKDVAELIALSQQPEEPEVVDQPLPKMSVSSHEFRLAFGHSLWGAPIFHATFEGRIPEFAVTSFAKANGKGGIDPSNLIWLEPGFIPSSPGPGNDDLSALASVDVLTLLRQGKVDVGAIPGNIVPEDFVRIGTIVDSAAGCTLVCTGQQFPQLKEYEGFQSNQRGNKNSKVSGTSADSMALETRALADLINNEKRRDKIARIGVEENTIADEFLRDICDRDPSNKLVLKDLKWHLRSSELSGKSLSRLRKECAAERHGSDLLGVIVWEPHASWMTIIGESEGDETLRKVPIHFSPSELGRPHHLSYEIVIRGNKIGRMNPKEKELRAAVSNLLYELWDSGNRLNKLRKDSADNGTIEQLAKYYKLNGLADEVNDQTIERTLKAVGSILYSVRWDVQGLSSLF
jgi:transcriptional regulator with XRE-family HTH domain